MNILHVVPSYIPAFAYGGPIKVTHELCKTLVHQGIRVTVFTTNMNGKQTLNVDCNRAQCIDGVNVFYFPVTFMRSYCYSPRLGKELKKHVRNFDVVHVHSVYLYPTFIASFWCAKYNIPYIINPFGALDIDMMRLRGFIRKKVYLSFVETRNIDNAAAIQATSTYEKIKMQYFRFKSRIVIIPRGIDISQYVDCRDKGYLVKRYPELRGKKIILFLGRIHPKKGLELLADAFKMVIQSQPDARLVIAGIGDHSYNKKVRFFFKKKNINKHTVFTGILLGENKISAFYDSHVFVLPSYGDNFGVAVLEAMACGLPVIVSDRVGLCPDIEKHNAGFVTECNVNQIAEKILMVLRNDALQISLGQNGIKLVASKFTLDDVTIQTASLYRKVLSR